MPRQVWLVRAFAVAILAPALTVPLVAFGATLTVTDLGDTGAAGQLRTLLNVAAPGDTIVIPSGIITLTTFNFEDGNATGDLDIHKDLTIQGAGVGLTIIAGGERLFDIFAPAIVSISGVTVRNGFGEGGGGGIRNAGTLTLINVTVSDNRSSSFQLLGLQNMTGGGILNNGTMTLTNCTISSNTANFGRGGGIANTGTMTLTGVTLNANTANDFQGGGGSGIANTGTLTLTNGSVSGNSAAGGGGIFNGGTFASETSSGIVVTAIGGTLSLTNVTLTNNTGGGLSNIFGSTATLTDVTIAGNTVQGSGAGIANGGGGTATLTNVTLSNNTASGGSPGDPFVAALGGGISNVGTLTLSNVTVSGNRADHGGGGIANLVVSVGDGFGGRVDLIGSLTLTNVTISNNTGGGILGVDGTSFGAGKSSAQLRNTIVANSPSAGNCSGSPGTITSLGHNLDSGSTCGFTGPGDLSNTDPKLGLLQNNGGFTLTHALLPGSPAINAGDNSGCPPTDQRGITRPQGAACDIGAYEFVGGSVAQIPAVNQWGMIGLGMGLAVILAWRLRRRSPRA
jgi:hypothetical protein